jgi:glycosyltransferase involved in cell wall biosynthesis
MRFYYGRLLRAGRAQIVASSDNDRRQLLQDAPWLADQARTFENALELRGLLTLPRTPVVGRVIVIGRVVQSKGLDDLVAALAHLTDVEWTLEVAGAADPAEIQRLARLAFEAGVGDRVRFRGAFRDADLGVLLGSAAVAAFPSRSEGFGLALLEAMAAGVPVVARGIPAHRELLGSDLNQLITDFDQPALAAVVIRELLGADERRTAKLSSALRSRAAAYDMPRLEEQITGLYRELHLIPSE